MKKQNVSRAVAALVKEKVLVRESPFQKRNGQLKLSSKYGWKGKLKNLRIQRKLSMQNKTGAV